MFLVNKLVVKIKFDLKIFFYIDLGTFINSLNKKKKAWTSDGCPKSIYSLGDDANVKRGKN